MSLKAQTKMIDLDIFNVSKAQAMAPFWRVVQQPNWFKRTTLERMIHTSGMIIQQMEKALQDMKKELDKGKADVCKD